MLRLLTEEGRNAVKKHYSEHRMVVMLWAMIAVLFVGIIGLLPSYVFSAARKAELTERIKITGEPGVSTDLSEAERWLSQTEMKLKILNPKLDDKKPSELIKSVLDKRFFGIRLTGIVWTNEENKPAVSISGVALDRQTLISFEDSLKSSELFSGVGLPLSNLAKDKDISFQLKLFLKKP